MKKFSKFIALLLCLALAATFFAACTPPPQSSEGTYTVTFSENYAGAPAATYVEVEENDTVAKPEDPTRSGYAFVGWYTEALGINEFSFDTPITEDIRLFAKWGMTVATVTFELGDGSQPQSQQIDVGETVAKPASDPERTDYEFTGWYADRACTQEFDFSAPIRENTTIYAGWNQLRATVTFLWYTGKTETAKVDVGNPVARPAEDPTREDYAFTGWFSDPGCTEEYDFTADVNGDITVYAGWNLTNATITLNYNYEGAPASGSVKAAIGQPAAAPEDPERTGYDFTGWYIDAACTELYDFETAVNNSFALYAGWTLHEYTVTFDMNGGSGENIVTKVLYNQLAVQPENDPVRTGYTFLGWYADAAHTTQFNFNAPITADTVIYAGWQSESSSGTCELTYYLNYEGATGTYYTDSVRTGRYIDPPATPVRAGYYFAGWATDQAGENLFDFNNNRATTSMNFYAKWLKGYTFEAEYTNITNPAKPGQGTSDNTSGLGLIQSVADVAGNGTEMGISNGYYIGKLYYTGASLEFEINAAEAVDDVVLVLRLTPDWYDYILTDQGWQVRVNGTALSYGSLELSGAVGEADGGDTYKRPFENYEISVRVQLNAGKNTIQLYTANSNNHGGTYNAETPLIDCIYLYSDVELSWAECHPENVGKAMADVTYDVTYPLVQD